LVDDKQRGAKAQDERATDSPIGPTDELDAISEPTNDNSHGSLAEQRRHRSAGRTELRDEQETRRDGDGRAEYRTRSDVLRSGPVEKKHIRQYQVSDS
jgi:hypothetical protein